MKTEYLTRDEAIKLNRYIDLAQDAGITLESVCEDTGISRTSINYYRRSERKWSRMRALSVVAAIVKERDARLFSLGLRDGHRDSLEIAPRADNDPL